MQIRPAASSDARDVARVHVDTWRAAYRGLVPEEYLQSLSEDTREQMWRETIARGTPELWVAAIESRIVGWTAFGPCRDPGAEAATGELWAIYVEPLYWMQGIGRELWLVTRRRLMERGYSSATLRVLSGNAKAIRFYCVAGFAPDPESEKEISIGGVSLREIRYGMEFAAQLPHTTVGV
jgi:ribosomal protein S18 acetylase RimI-like enzyme